MKKLLLLAFVCLGSLASFATSNNDYFVDDQKVEQLFAGSVDVSISAFSDANLQYAANASLLNPNAAHFSSGSDKEFVVALLLNLFLGVLGIHRLYLGTATLTWVGYILTIGGIFGIVPLIDLIVLIIHNQDISPYVNNRQFFMWAN